jgi:glucosyl-3-phosphoglycerate synthase
MPDFQQNVVPTFTRLVDEDLGQMEIDTLRAARRMPIGVIIPALFSDLSSPAMQHIIQQLVGMIFVKRIYVSLAQSSEAEFERAREIIQPIENRGVLLWNDAPGVQP